MRSERDAAGGQVVHDYVSGNHVVMGGPVVVTDQDASGVILAGVVGYHRVSDSVEVNPLAAVLAFRAIVGWDIGTRGARRRSHQAMVVFLHDVAGNSDARRAGHQN